MIFLKGYITDKKEKYYVEITVTNKIIDNDKIKKINGNVTYVENDSLILMELNKNFEKRILQLYLEQNYDMVKRELKKND